MKRIAIAILAILQLAIFSAPALAENGVPKGVVGARKSVYRVYSEVRKNLYAMGSGFVIATDEEGAYLITNYHVVEDAREDKAEIALHDGDRVDAEIVAYDEDHDVCILKTEKPLEDAAPLMLADEESIQVGESVYTLGYPGAGDAYINDLAYHYEDTTITGGIISAIKRGAFNDNKRSTVLQIDAAVNGGNSGGPLMNAKAEVVGINTYGVVGAENINAAVSVMHIIALLEENEVPFTYAAAQQGEGSVSEASPAGPAGPVRPQAQEVSAAAQTAHVTPRSPAWALVAYTAIAMVVLAGLILLYARYLRRLKAKLAAGETLPGRPVFPAEEGTGEGQASPAGKANAWRRFLVKKQGKWVAAAVGALLAAAVVAGGFWLGMDMQLGNAKQYTGAGQYQPAVRQLNAMPAPYADSEWLRAYLNACDALESEEYDLARRIFTSLGSYRDSAEKVRECDYRVAARSLYTGEYAPAMLGFEALGEYGDAPEKYRESAYWQGVEEAAGYAESLSPSSAQNALRCFAAAGDYQDAQHQAQALQEAVYRQSKDYAEKIILWLRAYQLHYADKIAETAQHAIALCEIIPAYEDGEELIAVMEALKNVEDVEESYGRLIPYWGNATANRILLSNYYLGWHLRGGWKGDGKYFYHAPDVETLQEDYADGYPYYEQANFKRALPADGKVDEDVHGVFSDIPVESGKYYFIENRRLYTGTRKGFWRMWKESYVFDFPDADTIVITDKDDEEYTLKREP